MRVRQKMSIELMDMVLISLMDTDIVSKLKCWYAFRKILANNYSKIMDLKYEACESGNLNLLKQLCVIELPDKGLLYKAINHNRPHIVEYLVNKTGFDKWLIYDASCKNSSIYNMLIENIEFYIDDNGQKNSKNYVKEVCEIKYMGKQDRYLSNPYFYT
jgi:hypothetical protein